LPLAVLAPEEGGFLLDELFAAIEEQGYQISRVADEVELGTYTRRLVLPEPAEGTASFTESLLAGHAAKIRLVRDGAGTAANLDQVRLGRAVYGLLANLVVLEANGAEVTRASIDALQEAPRALKLTVEPAGKRLELPSGYSQTVPGTLVMFTLLVLLTSGSVQLLVERRRGLLRRLASTPISRPSIVLGKWLGRMGLAAIQIGFAMLGGTLLFGMEWGEDLLPVLVVLGCWAAFCTSAALFLANVVRTEQQMAGIGVVSSLVLAALGGCWWPIEITPDWMQSLAQALPTGWTMDALHQLIHFGNGPASALRSVLLLLVAALVLGSLAVRHFRYQ
jgi:ABC-type Na+ efflux pump permease subunit